jgi:predicted nucleic acid-binding protein
MALPGLRLYRLEADLFMEAIVLAADKRLRGADAVYVAVARSVGVPLLSWDAEQLERASAVVTTVQPGDPTSPLG